MGLSGPRIFDLSPPGLGGARLAALMQRNGIRATDGEDGALARDIEWGALTGSPPCPDRPGIRFYTGLEAARDIALPPAFGWRHFRYLRQVFGQAVFLLVLRPPEVWTAARLTERGGLHARAEAITRRCRPEDLPALWWRDLAGLVADARAFFAGDPRYVELDYDALSFQTLRDALAPWYRLERGLPPPPKPEPEPEPPPPPAPPMPRPWPAPGRIAPPLRGTDARFAQDMAAFCLGTWAPNGAGVGAASGLYAHFDGVAGARRKQGRPWALMRHPDLPGRPFIQPGGDGKAARLSGVLNEVLRLGRLRPLHIDMQDARFLGTGPGTEIGVPLLAYNRRQGARNLVLWPLPGYHTPGAMGFAHAISPDTVPWADKADRVVWRGDLSGQARREDGGFGPSAFRLLEGLDRLDPGNDAGLAAVLEQLRTVPRMAALTRLTGADYDLGLTLSNLMREFAGLPFIAPYLDGWRRPDWFHGFRYILSLPGYDAGSNFLMAANSGSVVMKAEDGWELFHSHLFRAWEHYIPIAVDCADVPERLDWARAHQMECRAMVRAAQAACARLADTRLRAAALHLVLDGLEGRE